MSVRESIVMRARPIAAGAPRRRRWREFIVAGAIAACAIVLAIAHFDGIAHADASAAAAAQISDGAFAMLNGLNARGASSSNPALGSVAIFAGDAHSLGHSLASGDRAGAASALAALESDRGAVDSAVASNPGLFNATDWNRIKFELAMLSKQLGARAAPPRAAAGPAASAISGTHSPSSVAPVAPRVAAAPAPTSASTASSVGSAPATAPDSSRSAPPLVVIESRIAEGSAIHIKGYLEGSGLKRGGIYAGSREVRDFKVGGVAGKQRLNFDIGVENPGPDAMIRVYDVDGRMAEAPIADAALASSSSDSPSASSASADAARDAPEIPSLPSSADISSKHAPSTEGGVEVFRNTTAGDGGMGTANTAEIPSHGTPRRSPSKRRTLGSHLGNVQINVSAANEIALMPPTFELIGQILGHGVTRAGIYVGGRLVKPITVEFGENVTNFDVKFTSNGGDARIRAYGIGDQFVESSVDLSTATASADASMNAGTLPPGAMYGGPMVGADSGILVQIAGVGPITRNLYVVSGVISGRNLSGAGLYQNGMLVQRIPIGSGGIGGVIGALIPGASRNVNFNVRFNPQAGPATIRAFDSSGGYNEQPVIVAGMNPYGGGVNPYGMNPYGANPYGNPYGTNPYGANPYGSYGPGLTPSRPNPYPGGAFGPPPISPLLPPANPFGSPPASSW